MTVTASQVFSFLEQHSTSLIERREIHQGVFSILRQNIRAIVLKLKEDGDDESQEIADRLRRLLSEWLTVPVSFDDALLESVSSLGDGEAVLPAPECAMRCVRLRSSTRRGGSTATEEPALHSNPSSQMIHSLPRCFSIRSKTTERSRRLTC
jgi:hypothetical protein